MNTNQIQKVTAVLQEKSRFLYIWDISKIIATSNPELNEQGIPGISSEFLQNYRGMRKDKLYCEMVCECNCPGFPLGTSCMERNNCLIPKTDENKNIVLISFVK